MVDLTTPSHHEYMYFDAEDVSPMLDNQQFTFAAQIANDAHVLLKRPQADNSENGYEIVIGGWANTKSVLRDEKQGSPVATHSSRYHSKPSYSTRGDLHNYCMRP